MGGSEKAGKWQYMYLYQLHCVSLSIYYIYI